MIFSFFCANKLFFISLKKEEAANGHNWVPENAFHFLIELNWIEFLKNFLFFEKGLTWLIGNCYLHVCDTYAIWCAMDKSLLQRTTLGFVLNPQLYLCGSHLLHRLTEFEYVVGTSRQYN